MLSAAEVVMVRLSERFFACESALSLSSSMTNESAKLSRDFLTARLAGVIWSAFSLPARMTASRSSLAA